MDKQMFKVGDKVFDVMYGWGKVISILERSTCEASWVYVEFQVKNVLRSYTCDGRLNSNDPYPRLSFTEYTLEGFSQERPVNYKDYIGKWGKFWNDNLVNIFIDVLDNIYEEDDGSIKFISCEINSQYKNFEPLTEEQLKVLGLENY